MQNKQRLGEIDLIKAIAILTVILIHVSDRVEWQNMAMMRLLDDWNRFAVQFFIITAGFLFNKTEITTWKLAQKLAQRILLPYLICSLLMLWCRRRWLEPYLPTFDLRELVQYLFWGEALGIYYFVFVISYLYAFSLWLRYWPVWRINALWVLALIALLLLCGNVQFPGFQPDVRHPAVYLFSYITGWLLALHYTAIRAWLQRYSGRFLMLSLILEIGVISIMAQSLAGAPSYQFLLVGHIYVLFLGLLSLGIRWPLDVWLLRFLSTSSFALYLLHYPVVRLIQYSFIDSPVSKQYHRFFSLWQGLFGQWLIASIATLLIILLLKRVLGKNSFFLIGA